MIRKVWKGCLLYFLIVCSVIAYLLIVGVLNLLGIEVSLNTMLNIISSYLAAIGGMVVGFALIWMTVNFINGSSL